MNDRTTLEGEYDYIVVGAGSAGCLLANRLSADPSLRVLVLEAGGNDNRFWIHVPMGYAKTFTDPRVNWMFESAPEPRLNNRRLYLSRGKVLGGTSSINGLVKLDPTGISAAVVEGLRTVADIGQGGSGVLGEIESLLADTAKARRLQPDGTYVPVKPRRGKPAVRSQSEFMRFSAPETGHAPASRRSRPPAKTVRLRPRP